MTNRVYTRRGDQGETSLLGQGSVPKSDPRIHALGEIDEAASAIGLARAALCASTATDIRLDEALQNAQRCLSECAALIAAPDNSDAGSTGIDPEKIASLECFIDDFSRITGGMPQEFVLPGECERSARLHLARSVVRRAERSVVALLEDKPATAGVLAYMNRLSDALFAMAVYVSATREITPAD